MAVPSPVPAEIGPFAPSRAFSAHFEFDVGSARNVAGDSSGRPSPVGKFDISSLSDGPPGFKDNGPARPKCSSGDLDVPPDRGRALPLILIHIRTAVAVVCGLEDYGKLGVLGHGPFFQQGNVPHDFPGSGTEVPVDGHSLKS